MELVCGVDEAGRGPLAGPVYAAAVILDPVRKIDGLADSKKLSHRRRVELAVQIRAISLAWSVAFATVDEVDELNILQATLLAMRRAVEALNPGATSALIDGNRLPLLDIPARAIVRGDVSIPEISAASILAKTERDAEMLRLHQCYPSFSFDRHKGYDTIAHRQELERYGATPCHRRSFSPVRRVCERLHQQ